MNKTAKQAIMDYFGVALVPESLLKEIEAIISEQVIGYTQYPDQGKDVTYEMYIESTLQSKQRQALQTALYGNNLTNGEIADSLFVDEED